MTLACIADTFARPCMGRARLLLHVGGRRNIHARRLQRRNRHVNPLTPGFKNPGLTMCVAVGHEAITIFAAKGNLSLYHKAK